MMDEDLEYADMERDESPPSEAILPAIQRKRRRVKKKKKEELTIDPSTLNIPGVSKIVISPLCQKMLRCAVGEDVTEENPWKYIEKQVLQDDLELHSLSSEFLPIKKDVLAFPRKEMLMGYIPSEISDYDEFFICVTEPAEDSVSEILQTLKAAKQERLNNSIYKTVKKWRTYGSEKEVDDMQDIQNRPLIEVELETTYPVMKTKSRFKMRSSQDVKDGYSEFVAGRIAYVNIQKSVVDVGVQASPLVKVNDAQTFCTYPVNVGTQYEYTYTPPDIEGKNFISFTSSFQQFAENEMDSVSDMMNINSCINHYRNDYQQLIKDKKSTIVPKLYNLKDYTCLSEETMCKHKIVSGMVWHPMWTGTLVVCYSTQSFSLTVKGQQKRDDVLEAIYDVPPVLLWSFKDTLNPRLLLENYRVVQTVSCCPYDENIIVGGCFNGQVIIWDIKNKLKAVEEEEILTTAQQNYRRLMQSRIGWMKNTKDIKKVRPAAISDLDHSHYSAITCIRWLSAYREVTKTGQIRDIPEDAGRTSLQFITASTDGTLLIWDLTISQGANAQPIKVERKVRRLKRRPSALAMDVSPLRVLNRILKPVFKVNVCDQRNHPFAICNISVSGRLTKFEEVDPDPQRKFNITDRIIYKPILLKPETPLINQVSAGTAEGDFLILQWEGFDFNSGETVNKDIAKLISSGKYHDGPVVSVVRSAICPDVTLTVGGRVFCVWRDDLKGRPFIWKRSPCRYTRGVWNKHRPVIFRLTRDDGHVEMWNFRVRSDSFIEEIKLSNYAITGTRLHSLYMKQNVVGIADSRGAVRLLYIARNLIEAESEDSTYLGNFCEREVTRKKRLALWQEQWCKKNADFVAKRTQEQQLRQQEKVENLKREKEKSTQLQEDKEDKQAAQAAAINKPEPGKFDEWAQKQWEAKEKDRMNKLLLGKKALDIGLLERQQEPLAQVREEEQLKEEKRLRRLEKADQLFMDAVATLFPDAIEHELPPPQDPYVCSESKETLREYYERYEETEKLCKAFVEKRSFKYDFNWVNFMKSGKERRRIIDGYYKRPSHKDRLIRERKLKEAGIQGHPVNPQARLEETRTAEEQAAVDVVDNETIGEIPEEQIA